MNTQLRTGLALALGLFLFHCSSAPEGGNGSEGSATSSGLCATFCDRLTTCDTSQDRDTCSATCNDEIGRSLDRMRDDVQTSISACVDALDCKTVLQGDGVGDCVKQAAASVAPSATDKKSCEALVKAEVSCGNDAASVAGCLDNTKIYSDATLNQVLACTKKPCSEIDACLGAALGMASGGSADGGAGSSASGDAGKTDSGKSDSGTRDAGHADSAPPAACPGIAPTSTELDANGGFKPPPARIPGACSATDIQRFQSNFNTANTYSDLGTGLSASCVSCVFSHESDAAWTEIVTDPSGIQGFVNFGACYAAKSGVDGCGKAVEYQELCISVSCAACSSANASSCSSSTTVQNACDANFGAAIGANCPSDPTTAKALDDTCGNVVNAVTFLCGN